MSVLVVDSLLVVSIGLRLRLVCLRFLLSLFALGGWLVVVDVFSFRAGSGFCVTGLRSYGRRVAVLFCLFSQPEGRGKHSDSVNYHLA